ncbi:hypothetical protein ACFSJW_10400 [Flavobacterium artemisiae]|uniref:DUF4271 domain-containing protein n=1 Tax=Flavobacterium artemisiae TaxID=2126556 RepID=A0ABW4HEG1_9FLAO
MKNFLFLFLLFAFRLYANDPAIIQNKIAVQVSSLNNSQKAILYEYAVLKMHNANAERYWELHEKDFVDINDSVRDQLASEIYTHTQFSYKPDKNFSTDTSLKVQLLSNWMFYLAALIAVLALIQLFKNYWSWIIQVLIKKLAPIFRLLFSPILLTYEMLLAGGVCIFFGCFMEEFVSRTIVIHIGIFLLWSQSTAILTQKYLAEKYIFDIPVNFWGNDSWKTLKTISIPAFIIVGALVYVIVNRPNETFYIYELVAAVIASVYTLPFWRSIEKYLSRLLFPFKDDLVERSVYTLASVTILALLATVLFVFNFSNNIYFAQIIVALVSLLSVSFLILSFKWFYRRDYRNYYYVQFVTFAYLLTALYYGFYVQSIEIVWMPLLCLSFFVIIKYWEIITSYFYWKNSKTKIWGFLGMSVLLWVLGKGVLYLLNFVL